MNRAQKIEILKALAISTSIIALKKIMLSQSRSTNELTPSSSPTFPQPPSPIAQIRASQFLLFAGSLVGILLLRKKRLQFKGKSIVITGGSRGLGLALAQCLLEEGASVTLLARDPEELRKARNKLYMFTKQIFDVTCDITHQQQLEFALAEARAKFGKIDILINNAGSLTAGPLNSLTDNDFQNQMNVHYFSAINAIRAIRPYFHQQGGGIVVNISSIGGLLPLPYLSAHCGSKFALGGASESLAIELRKEGIQLTTIYPGFMRTGSTKNAQFKNQNNSLQKWVRALDNLPVLSISPRHAAKKILSAVALGKSHLVLTAPAKLGVWFHMLFPETYSWTIAAVDNMILQEKKNRPLSQLIGDPSKHRRLWFSPVQWAQERAEEENNQLH